MIRKICQFEQSQWLQAALFGEITKNYTELCPQVEELTTLTLVWHKLYEDKCQKR